METPKTVDQLFESVLLTEDDICNAVEDDLDDELLDQIDENKKVSIFDSDFILEGE